MQEERHNLSEQPSRLVVARGVEIGIGQTVPILQHSGCAGLEGEVYEIDPKNRIYKIFCKTCKRGGVILDTRNLVGKK